MKTIFNEGLIYMGYTCTEKVINNLLSAKFIGSNNKYKYSKMLIIGFPSKNAALSVLCM